MVSVAQLVEPRIVIPVVVGSSPIVHPSFSWAMHYKLALIGKDVSQSLSPLVYQYFFSALGISFSYDTYGISENNLTNTVKELVNSDYFGFNVTNPYKRDLAFIADLSSSLVKKFSSTNVVKINSGKLSCYSTDGAGFCDHIISLVDLSNTSVIILGAGGVVPCITKEILYLGANVTVVARDVSKAKDYLCVFGNAIDIVENVRFTEPHILINATGVSCDKIASLNGYDFSNTILFYDLAYGNSASVSLRMASSTSRTSDGLGMLVYQAAYAIKIWTGIMPSKELCQQIIRDISQKSLF